MQNLTRNWLVISKLTWGISQILTQVLESLKNFHFNSLYFWANYILFDLKKYRGVIFQETEEGYKIWGGIDLSFQNWHKEFRKFWPEHLKVSKILTLIGSFWAKYIYIFWAKKVPRSYLWWNWKGIQNLDRNRLVASKLALGISQILTQALESLKNFHFNRTYFWANYILFDLKKVQRSYLSGNWRRIQNLGRNRLVVSKLA